MDTKKQPLPKDLIELAEIAADEKNEGCELARWILEARKVKALEEIQYNTKDHAISSTLQ